jgi:hypothetical protein
VHSCGVPFPDGSEDIFSVSVAPCKGTPSRFPKLNCMCHMLTKEKGELTHFTQNSWKTTWNAAEVHRDAAWDSLKSFQVTEPVAGYHRCCYQTYTHTGKL